MSAIPDISQLASSFNPLWPLAVLFFVVVIPVFAVLLFFFPPVFPAIATAVSAIPEPLDLPAVPDKDVLKVAAAPPNSGEVAGEFGRVGAGEVADEPGEVGSGQVVDESGEVGSDEAVDESGQVGSGQVADEPGEVGSNQAAGESGSGRRSMSQAGRSRRGTEGRVESEGR